MSIYFLQIKVNLWLSA